MSMIRSAPLLRILDEPACGVDIESRKYLWKYLRERKDCLTLLTTHIMEEAEELCDEVVILKSGKLVAYGSLLFIKKKLGSGWIIRIKTDDKQATKDVIAQSGCADVVVNDSDTGLEAVVPFASQEEVPQLLRALRGTCETQLICPSLTEVFLRVCDNTEAQGEPKIE